MSIPLKAEVCTAERFGLDTRALVGARRFIARSLPAMPEETLADVVMAVDEALANVVEHSGAPAESRIDLKVVQENGHVRILITSDGDPFEGESAGQVDLQAHLAARRTGGLGIFLMKQLMDMVLFRTTRDGRQELVMVKQL